MIGECLWLGGEKAGTLEIEEYEKEEEDTGWMGVNNVPEGQNIFYI